MFGFQEGRDSSCRNPPAQSRAHTTPEGIHPRWGFCGRDRGTKVLKKKFCSSPTDTQMRREGRSAGSWGLCLPSHKYFSCSYQVCALSLIITPKVGTASFARFLLFVFDFSYPGKYLCISPHLCIPTSKHKECSPSFLLFPLPSSTFPLGLDLPPFKLPGVLRLD